MEGWGKLSHLYVTVFLAYIPVYLVYPTASDVIVEALCGGEDKSCSLAIYLAGAQQSIVGVGAVVMMPLIGNLSDACGRKYLFAVPLTLQIIPLLIMALNRSANFFYAYFTIKTFTDMIVDGGVVCLCLGYLADNVKEGNRVGAFAVFNGVMCVANVCGTLAAALLSISHIFQVAAAFAVVAAVYMRVFLKDNIHSHETQDLKHPFFNSDITLQQTGQLGTHSSEGKEDSVLPIPSPKDVYLLLKSSKMLALATSVSFFNSVAEAGYNVFLMYFLKARFGFDKDQFSVVFLITNLAAALTNLLLMPLLGPFIGEDTLLCFGLFNGFLSMLLHSIAWAPWVPYFSASLGMFYSLSPSCIRSIVSRQVGPNEQGIAQGSLLSLTAFANIVSPLVFSPLSALFLSDKAPFRFPGFCILCIGVAYLIGLILSVIIKMKLSVPRRREQIDDTWQIQGFRRV